MFKMISLLIFIIRVYFGLLIIPYHDAIKSMWQQLVPLMVQNRNVHLAFKDTKKAQIKFHPTKSFYWCDLGVWVCRAMILDVNYSFNSFSPKMFWNFKFNHHGFCLVKKGSIDSFDDTISCVVQDYVSCRFIPTSLQKDTNWLFKFIFFHN